MPGGPLLPESLASLLILMKQKRGTDESSPTLTAAAAAPTGRTTLRTLLQSPQAASTASGHCRRGGAVQRRSTTLPAERRLPGLGRTAPGAWTRPSACDPRRPPLAPHTAEQPEPRQARKAADQRDCHLPGSRRSQACLRGGQRGLRRSLCLGHRPVSVWLAGFSPTRCRGWSTKAAGGTRARQVSVGGAGGGWVNGACVQGRPRASTA